MRMYLLSLVALVSLGGCVSYDLSTPEGVAQYERDMAIYQQMGARAQAQSQALIGAVIANNPAPQPIGSYQQPNGTAIVYCRDLSGNVIACKQLN